MIDCFELKGKWYLPNNPKKVAYGIASFHPVRGCSLELLGSFNDEFFDGDVSKQEVIWGITNDSKCHSHPKFGQIFSIIFVNDCKTMIYFQKRLIS